MPFLPGNNANPHGRPRKAPDIRHEIMHDFCSKNREDIEKVADLVLEKAVKDKEPWAIKLAVEMLYPKSGTTGAAAMEKNTTNNNLNVKIGPLLKDFSAEDQRALWDMLKRAKQKQPMLMDGSEEKVG